jgi:hypothetical protein
MCLKIRLTDQGYHKQTIQSNILPYFMSIFPNLSINCCVWKDLHNLPYRNIKYSKLKKQLLYFILYNNHV